MVRTYQRTMVFRWERRYVCSSLTSCSLQQVFSRLVDKVIHNTSSICSDKLESQNSITILITGLAIEFYCVCCRSTYIIVCGRGINAITSSSHHLVSARQSTTFCHKIGWCIIAPSDGSSITKCNINIFSFSHIPYRHVVRITII